MTLAGTVEGEGAGRVWIPVFAYADVGQGAVVAHGGCGGGESEGERVVEFQHVGCDGRAFAAHDGGEGLAVACDQDGGFGGVAEVEGGGGGRDVGEAGEALFATVRGAVRSVGLVVIRLRADGEVSFWVVVA